MDINFDQTIIALGSKIKILPTEKINKVMFIPAFTLVESYKISFVNITTHQVTTFNCNI